MERTGKVGIGMEPEPRDEPRFDRRTAAGKVTPAVDRVYPLARAPDAIRDLHGAARGKLVVAV